MFLTLTICFHPRPYSTKRRIKTLTGYLMRQFVRILDHIPLKEGLGEPPSVPPEGGKVSVAAGTRLWHIRLRGCCKINYLLSRRTAQGCRPYSSPSPLWGKSLYYLPPLAGLGWMGDSPIQGLRYRSTPAYCTCRPLAGLTARPFTQQCRGDMCFVPVGFSLLLGKIQCCGCWVAGFVVSLSRGC